MEIGKFTEPVSKLIEAIKESIGVLYEPKRIEKKAKAEVNASLYKKIGEIIESKLDERALLRWIDQENRKQLNIDNIVQFALLESNQKSNLNSDSVADQDWLIEFFNLGQHISNEELQLIWAKLLSNEVDKPGSYSRRTLQTLRLLSIDEAQLFSKFCKNLILVIDDDETNIGMVVHLLEDGSYFDDNWTISGYDIGVLQEVGLVLDYSLILEAKRKYEFIVGNEKFTSSPKIETDLELMSLTKVGQEIYSIMSKDKNLKYLEETLQILHDKGLFNS